MKSHRRPQEQSRMVLLHELKNYITINYLAFLENDQEEIAFLKHYTEPWEEVVSKWKDTAKWRKRSEKRTVKEFINEWPIVKDIRAEQLVSISGCLKLPYNYFIF